MSQRTIREPVRSQTLDDRGYIPTTNNDRDGNRLRPQPNLAVGDPWDDVVDQGEHNASSTLQSSLRQRRERRFKTGILPIRTSSRRFED